MLSWTVFVTPDEVHTGMNERDLRVVQLHWVKMN